MLAKLKSLLKDSFSGAEDESAIDIQEQLKMASAILLLEVARTDHNIEDTELNQIKTVIQDKFDLSSEASQALMDEADESIEDIIDFHQFTSLLNEHFEIEQKCLLIEYMWQIALSDGYLDAYEDQFIRKISNLLYLRHSELISARERAKASL